MRLSAFAGLLLALVGLAAPAAAQQVIEERGRVAHDAAATAFPDQIGSFRRANVVRYTADGQDMSASYNLENSSGRMLVSVYVYPPRLGRDAGDCREEFDGALQAIHSQQRSARVVERTLVPSIAGFGPNLARGATLGFTANFLSGELEEVHSGLYLYCFVGTGAWMVKYRVTYNADFENAPGLIDWFVRNGPWPGREPADSIAALIASRQRG